VVACIAGLSVGGADDLDVPMWTYLGANGVAAVALLVRHTIADAFALTRGLGSLLGDVGRIVVLEAAVATLPFLGTVLGGAPEPDLLGLVFLLPALGLIALLLVPACLAIVVAPLITLVTQAVPALRGDVAAQVRWLFSVLLLAIVGGAVAASAYSRHPGRGGLLHDLLVLVTLADPRDGAPSGAVWAGRATALLALAALAGLTLLGLALARRRAESPT